LTEFTLALFIEYHNLIRSNVLFLNLIVVETTEVFRGCLYSVDWTRDWTVGLDCGPGLRGSCANRFEWL